MKIVICGFGSAGYAAAMAAKRIDPKTEITVIDLKEYDLFHPCGLPFALEGIVDYKLLTQNVELHRAGITRIRGRSENIYCEKRTLFYSTEEGGRHEVYDRLIITTGSAPVVPKIANLDNYLNLSIFTFTGFRDLLFIKERIKTAEKCVIIGGGAIGIETAHALKTLGINVTLIEGGSLLLGSVLDPDMSQLVEDALTRGGVTVIKNRPVNAVEGNESLKQVICDDVRFQADIAIIAAGSKPELSLAVNSRIETSNLGIKTDERLMTSAVDVYAAGDCIVNYSSIDGKPVVSRLATSAYKQGIIAASNALGGDRRYGGTTATFATRFGSFEVAATGFNTETASLRGFEPASAKITSKIRPEYYPDNSDVTVKIVYDKNTGIVLGAQCAGVRGAVERVNLVSMAVEFGLTIDEFDRIELGYVPSVSEVYDPLLRAADFGVRRLYQR